MGQRFGDGEVIVTEGQPGDSMYVIQSGAVEVVKQSDSGDQSLGTLKQGQFFGEMAIFEDEVRSATVRAVGEAHVIEVDKKSVEKRIAENPRLAVNLLKEMSSRLRGSNARRLRGRRHRRPRADSVGEGRPSVGRPSAERSHQRPWESARCPRAAVGPGTGPMPTSPSAQLVRDRDHRGGLLRP